MNRIKLSFNKFRDINEIELDLIASETGADRESDFSFNKFANDIYLNTSLYSQLKRFRNYTARWSFSLDTECPKCEHYFNMDSINGYSYVIGNELDILEQDTVKSTNIEVQCPRCDHEFIIDCEY